MSKQRLALSVVLVIALLAPGASASLAQPVAPSAATAPGTVPKAMLIVENVGQWPAPVRFQVWNSPLGTGTTWLAEDAIWLMVAGSRHEYAGPEMPAGPLTDVQRAPLQPATLHALKLTFSGSSPDVRIEPFGQADTVVSYFIGKDPAQWRPAVPVWSEVRYVDLYPGVDLVLGGQLGAWRLEAKPGAAVDHIRVQVEGASVVGLDEYSLQLTVGGEEFFVDLPSAGFAYEAVGTASDDSDLSLSVRSSLNTGRETRVNEPPEGLIYSTFLGGADYDEATDVVVDQTGSAFVVGATISVDFPVTPGAFDPIHNGNVDVFVVRLDPAGSALNYATFLGGASSDFGRAIALDDAGTVTVAGYTEGNGFPTTEGAFMRHENGNGSGFVLKLSPTGTELDYSTYLGGSNPDDIYDVAVDSTGSAYVTGWTVSDDFPISQNSFGTNRNGYDAFIAKLDPTGSDLIYGAFLGGSSDDETGHAIAVDVTGSAYVTGRTDSSDFPTMPAAFGPHHAGDLDAFVVKVNPDGTSLSYSSYLGGANADYGYDIAVDALGCAYVTGRTESGDFPATDAAYDTTLSGPGDGFVAKVDAIGNSLVYATFLGGSLFDEMRSIAVDASGSVYVGGMTYLADFGSGISGASRVLNNNPHAFMALLNPAGTDLALATFLTTADYSSAFAIALDSVGHGFMAGFTDAVDFPTTAGAFDTTYNGASDAFVVQLALIEIRRCCDFNNNNLVEVGDLIAIAELWNQPAGPLSYLDHSADEMITIADIQWVARWWGWPIP